MRFLIDNALSPLLAQTLRDSGFDSVHVRDIGMQAEEDRERMGTDKIYLILDILSPMSDLISFSPHPTEECHAQNCQIYHFTPAHCLPRDLPDRPAGIPPESQGEGQTP